MKKLPLLPITRRLNITRVIYACNEGLLLEVPNAELLEGSRVEHVVTTGAREDLEIVGLETLH